jgi:hypothetical protein
MTNTLRTLDSRALDGTRLTVTRFSFALPLGFSRVRYYLLDVICMMLYDKRI